jgi:hypothetical protein
MGKESEQEPYLPFEAANTAGPEVVEIPADQIENEDCHYCQDNGPCRYCDRGKKESLEIQERKRSKKK